MLYIQDTLISLDVVDQHFICDLDACKGACCVQGDYGAPLSADERAILQDIFEDIRPYLEPSGVMLLEQRGLSEWNEEPQFHGTPLHPDGACAYLSYQDGIAMCGIERAYQAGATHFRKPLSCQMYPIRVSKNEETGWEAWNYDKWDICSAACTLGKKEQVLIYQFLKEAIIRAKGLDFYEELDEAAQHILTAQ